MAMPSWSSQFNFHDAQQRQYAQSAAYQQAYAKLQAQLNQLNQNGGMGQIRFSQQFGTVGAQPIKKITKEERIAQIEKELDIIRGVVPTPKGYKVNTTNAKSLMQELKILKGSK